MFPRDLLFLQESGTIIFGIVVKGTLGVSLIINGVETPLSITLSLGNYFG